MVSIRCKIIVEQELEKIGLHTILIELGRVEIDGTVSVEQIQKIRKTLLQFGLELLDDKKSILIERIKNVVVEMVHYSDIPLKIKFSHHLSKELNHDYTYLANIFSEAQGTTIEHFIILHKIQRAKELIWENELSLTEISWEMSYSSVAHLSAQFKKITGLTPSQYKHMEFSNHSGLENV